MPIANDKTNATVTRNDHATHHNDLADAVNDHDERLDSVEPAVDALEAAGVVGAAVLAGHVANVANPHQVTKAQVGLASAENTSDAAKPVSTAVAGEFAADRVRLDSVESDNAALVAATALPDLLLAGTLAGLGNSPYWLKVVGTKLYVLVTNDRVVRIYDIADPGTPVFLGQSPVLGGSGPAYVAVFGSYVFVTDQNDVSLRVIDAANPAGMTVVATLAYSSGGTGGGRMDVSSDGAYLLIGGPENGANANKAYLVSVATPTAPVVSGSTSPTGSTHRGVAFLGSSKWALASRDDHTVKIIDTIVPAAPAVIASFATAGTVTTPLAVDGTTLYVGDYGGGGLLSTYNVSNPASPVLLDTLVIGSGAEQIALGGGRAFIALRAASALALVDVTNAANLALMETWVAPGTVTPGAAYKGGYVYLTEAGNTTNGKLHVLAVEAVVATAVNALQGQVESVDAAKASLVGANAFSATQTMSAVRPLSFSGALPEIDWGGALLKRTAATLLRWYGVLVSKKYIAYPDNVGDAAYAVRMEVDTQDRWVVYSDGENRWSHSGTVAPSVRVSSPAANQLQVLLGDFLVATVGRGLRVKEGSNAKQGTTTLVAGTVVVANTSVTANSRIFVQRQTDGGTVAASYSITRTAATSFTITAKDGSGATQTADTSTLAFQIFEPA